jgi:hypothetical protein
MQTVFSNDTTNELNQRIAKLSAQKQALWGKMDFFQMLRHCTLSDELFQGRQTRRRLFIGRLFGRIALNNVLKSKGMRKNMPTHPDLKIKTSGDVEAEKLKWMALISNYTNLPQEDFMHPFFGKMTRDEIGQFVYKHADHHLKQFGC